ncbi:SDR family NAD(P)-dependent oxidoreductase [Nocardioides sp. AE5]|uniref:SDR family NAD(P)-dependent oxidoreductase n=1 Tax=Nocardioides sp. AE5 TaxID=2962573 RepID=UPI002880F5E6|nr:SDR family NAD(P)-dependent oxidoreductase [Nocardioides sp. AE5]MDT0203154.1 SDR family NAD(P)-dependent oxidoreductase [Nocardioides sp. AE5]
MSGIDGRKALVTGGASGIGLGIARRLRAGGAEVAVLDLPGDNLRDVRADGFSVVTADVRSRDEVAEAVAEACEILGGLDTLVLSAGVIHIKPLGEVTEEDWDLTLDVNLKGAFLVTQAAAPQLVASGRGRVVAISSDAGRCGVPLLHAYSASKAGLIGLAQALASELAPHVTVNCLCPVSTPETGMGQQVLAWKRKATGGSDRKVLDEISRIFPMARAGTSDDVAAAAEFLISDGAGFITGVALDVDGGAALNSLPGAAQ